MSEQTRIADSTVPSLCEVGQCLRVGVQRTYGVTCDKHHAAFSAWAKGFPCETRAASESDRGDA